MRCLAAAALAGFLVQPLAAAEQWIKLTSSHFDLFTTAGEKKGREALLYFEQVRDFFNRTRPSDKPVPGERVRIVAFHSYKEYAPYRMNEFATAFYMSGYGDDCIVMRGISEESYPIAVHEYTHLLIRHTGLDVPAWLNEGLADLFSSLKQAGKRIVVGNLIPGRVATLQQSKWLPLDALLVVDHNSPYYNERNRASIFYAESWALVHMLYLSNEYRPRIDKFGTAIGSGVPSANAFWQVYAKTPAQVQKDLEIYLRGTRFNGAFFDLKLEKSAEEPDVTPASPLESGVALADILASVHKHDEAKEAYEALIHDFPKAWEPEAGLAELVWRDKQYDEATKHFARAAELGSTDARVYHDYARVARETKTRISALQKSLALDPANAEARRYLGSCLLQDGQYQTAFEQLLQVKNLKPEQAFSFYHEMSFAALHLGRLDDAQKAAEFSRKYARDSGETKIADDMLRIVAERRSRHESPSPKPTELAASPASRAADTADSDDRPTLRREEPKATPKTLPVVPVDPPPAPKPTVRGVLERIDCLGKAVRLRVVAEGKPVALAITDPLKVVVKGSATGTLDLTCGPQKAKTVILEHDGQADAKLGTQGVITSIEFH